MRHFLKRFSLLPHTKFPPSHPISKFRTLALAAAAATGIGVYCASNHHDDLETRISLSISPQFQENYLRAWGKIQEFYGPGDLLSSNSGHIPLSSSGSSFRSSPASLPTFNLSKETSGEIGDSAKCGCGNFSRDSIADAVAIVAPAVVNLSVTKAYYGVLGKSMASGTIIHSDGTILTCAHAVAEFQGARSITKTKVDVTLQDGRTFHGTVLNADFHSDIAVIKINSKTPLPTAKLGSSSEIRPGDWVLAMGSPLSLENTVTAGIVSCVDRKSSDLGLGGMRREFLQTDCAINMGNSGGPLVNLNGEIVGVNIMKIAAADGMSFAVPIDYVSKVIEHFKKNGRVVRPWLGLKMLDLNDMIIAQLKERDTTFPNVSKGVLVPMVTPGSPADRAGFLPGDVVIEFGGKSIQSIKEIIEIMGDDIGKPFEVILQRANSKFVKLTIVPEEANPDL